MHSHPFFFLFFSTRVFAAYYSSFFLPRSCHALQSMNLIRVMFQYTTWNHDIVNKDTVLRKLQLFQHLWGPFQEPCLQSPKCLLKIFLGQCCVTSPNEMGILSVRFLHFVSLQHAFAFHKAIVIGKLLPTYVLNFQNTYVHLQGTFAVHSFFTIKISHLIIKQKSGPSIHSPSFLSFQS